MKTKASTKTKNNYMCIVIIFMMIIETIIFSNVQFTYNALDYDKYYKGEAFTINGSANLIDYVNSDNNVLISPVNIYNVMGKFYNEVNSDSYYEFKNYFDLDVNDINNKLKIMNDNNNYDKKIKSKINDYYESLIKEFYEKQYDILTTNEIKGYKTKERESIIGLLAKINTTYNRINNLNKYTLKYLKTVKPSREELAYSPYEIRIFIDKILDEYENYALDNRVININNNYYDSDVYKIKGKNSGYQGIEFKKIDTRESLKQIENVGFELDSSILNNNDTISLNSLIFESVWEESFNIKNNKALEFTIDNNVKLVSMMQTIIYSYLENDNAVGFRKEFSNSKFSFIGILPKKKGNVQVSTINVEELLKTENKENPILLSIPKFKYSSTVDLKEIFQNVGIKKIFTKEADFNDFVKNKRFKIDYVLEKENITIAEKGTYITNINSQELETFVIDENMKKITFNRPFIFMIINNDTNDVLLIGKVNNPEQKEL